MAEGESTRFRVEGSGPGWLWAPFNATATPLLGAHRSKKAVHSSSAAMSRIKAVPDT